MSNEYHLRDPGLLFWVGFGVVLFGFVGLVVFEFVSVLVLAVFFYYCTRPLYRFLFSIVGNRSVASLGTIVVAVVPLLVFFAYFSSIALSELQSLLIEYNLTQYQEFIPDSFSVGIAAVLQEPILLLEESERLSPELVSQFNDWIVVVGNILSGIVLYLLVFFVVLFYLLKDASVFREWLDEKMRFVTPMWPVFADRVDSDLKSVFFGNILNMFLTGLISVAVFLLYNLVSPSVVSLAYPVLFGILAGLASLIPIIGMKIVYFPIAVYLGVSTVLRGQPELLLFVGVFFVLSALFVDFIPDVVIRPYVSGENLHIGLLLMAYITGPVLFGWYGFFLAPIVLVVLYHYASLMLPRVLPVLFSKRI